MAPLPAGVEKMKGGKAVLDFTDIPAPPGVKTGTPGPSGKF
jgi:hypothetical protein